METSAPSCCDHYPGPEYSRNNSNLQFLPPVRSAPTLPATARIIGPSRQVRIYRSNARASTVRPECLPIWSTATGGSYLCEEAGSISYDVDRERQNTNRQSPWQMPSWRILFRIMLTRVHATLLHFSLYRFETSQPTYAQHDGCQSRTSSQHQPVPPIIRTPLEFRVMSMISGTCGRRSEQTRCTS